MSLAHHSRHAERPSSWAVGVLALSILALAVAFALLALVP
jgi:hypothetical protein